MLYSDWPLVWTLYYLERKCIRLKFVIEGWLAGPWRPQRWSLPWSSCAVRTCPQGFLELLLVVLWAAAKVHANNTQKTGWPQSSTDFPTTLQLLLHWFSFKDFWGTVQKSLFFPTEWWCQLTKKNSWLIKLLWIWVDFGWFTRWFSLPCEDWNPADIARLDSKTEACRAPLTVRGGCSSEEAREESSSNQKALLYFLPLASLMCKLYSL